MEWFCRKEKKYEETIKAFYSGISSDNSDSDWTYDWSSTYARDDGAGTGNTEKSGTAVRLSEIGL